MWFRRDARHCDAVLAALATVGASGMTPLALAVTVDLPEARLQVILERLLHAGRIDRRVDAAAAVARLRRSRYRLAGNVESIAAQPG